ncbi:hypothetical protein L6452_16227 [Arctium lappa]|uniref:Uncharacterized protein n=1 Tax=Arctium lappa TaxID=4217 RepID=A0ACB9BZX8_ARCLA|nr:hypothetical protein L6452_16227 [Arctium lappa]
MGRIVAKDVEVAVVAGAVAAVAEPTKPLSVAPGIELGSVVPFTTMQGVVSRNMVESLGVPTFRVGYTITTDALDALYKKIKPKGVTMTALLAKATALALAKHPIVNSSCRDGKSFTYNSSINIAVAVAIDGGLITHVLQNADKKVERVGGQGPGKAAATSGIQHSHRFPSLPFLPAAHTVPLPSPVIPPNLLNHPPGEIPSPMQNLPMSLHHRCKTIR